MRRLSQFKDRIAYSAYILMPVAAAKESRCASAHSGWRTITWPSESNVCFQFRRGVPSRKRVIDVDDSRDTVLWIDGHLEEMLCIRDT